MGRSLNLNKLTGLVCLSFMGLGLTACDNAVFSSTKGDTRQVIKECEVEPCIDPVVNDIVFIDDSFERDDIYADFVNEIIYGWRGFILDGTNPVIGFQSNGAGARIPPVGELGPAADGDRFLLLNGREGTDVETIHVISQSYDLSQYNTAILSFKYLTFNLNDTDDTTPEGLELQVCRGTLNDCGANDDAISAAGQTSTNWVTVATNDATVNDDAFNGKNHAVTDWKQGLAVVDLRNPELVGDGSTFVFRFRAAMRDGLNTGSVTRVCEEKCDDVSDDHHDHDYEHCKDKKHHHKKHHDNGRHEGFDHSKHYGYDRVVSSAKEDDDKDYDHDDEQCKHDNGKHVGFDHSKHYGYDKHKKCKHKHKKHCHKKHCKNKHHCHKKHCKKECHDVVVPGDGTLKDGVAIDKVVGTATARTIEEIF